MDIHPAIYALIFVAGLVFGSFFNVAIHRWPLEDKKEREWIVTPSHCPKCNAQIRWYHNIPLLSYLILGGKCFDCKAPISIRYPMVELFNALLWLAAAWLVACYGYSGVGPDKLTYWHVAFAIVFTSVYFLTVMIDSATQLIPDEISILHFVSSLAFLFICAGATISSGILDSLIGMVSLAGFFFILAWFGWMGLGDVKLAAGLGLLFGWKLVIVCGFLAVFLGAIVGVAYAVYAAAKGKFKRGIPIPFGPFLAVAAFICMFRGHEILDWYLGFFPSA